MIIGIFTLFGIVALAANTILFILSFFIKNLFLQFLTGSIVFFFIYFFSAYILHFFMFKNRKIEALSVTHGTIHPFESVSMVVSINHVPLHLPGLYWYISFSLQTGDELVQTVASPVEFEGSRQLRLTTVINRHGRFMMNGMQLQIRDLLGFTLFRIPIEFQQTITIHPWFTHSVTIPYVLDKGGDQIIQSVIKVDSTDFFENRKYYPGDDIRKINWNIFAHSGELHVRDVEKTPPKIGQVSFIFAPWSKNQVEYEHCTSIFISTIYSLLQNGLEVKIYSPDSDQPVIIDEKSEKGLLRIINNSWRPLNPSVLDSETPSIAFASFDEYERLSGTQGRYLDMMKVAFISYYEPPVTRRSLLRLSWMIREYDRFIPEARMVMKQFSMKEKRRLLLERLQSDAESKKIELEVYSIHETVFAEN
jgi:uncharacterized protein (DUF58 family)